MGSAWRKLNSAQRRMRQGQPAEAEALLAEAVEALPGKAPPGIQLGLCRLASGEAAAAERSFEGACAADPSNPAAFLFRALAVSDQGRDQEASAHLEQARKLCRENQVLPTVEAVLALRQGELGAALARLGVSEARPSGGELANSGPVLGRLVIELERRLLPLEVPQLFRSEALGEESVSEEQEKSPGLLAQLMQLPASWKAMSLQKKALGKMDRAAGHRGIVQMLWSYLLFVPELLGLRGSPESAARIKARRYELTDEAVELYRAARDLDPGIFRAGFYLGEALLYGARLEGGEGYPRERLIESRECFYDAWRREGPNPYLFYYLGKASSLLGEVEAGAEYFRRALARFEKLPEARYGLGQCLLLMGQEVEARQSLLAAVQSDGLIARERLREFHEIHADRPELLSRPLPDLPAPGEATAEPGEAPSSPPASEEDLPGEDPAGRV
ncbi:MAG: tetratricopeptide repeat protein [Armatimonadetes bacterium]|nr:tetratricopeptide repeat protein [Armatimonadota bacterium]